MDNAIDIKRIIVIIHPWQRAEILKTYSCVLGKFRFSQHKFTEAAESLPCHV